MGRPRSFDEATVLDAAGAVFVRGGYEGTSVDDLVTALNLRRGSLYQAFGSKRGLFLAVLRRYVDTTVTDETRQVSELVEGDTLDLLLVAALERGGVDVEVAGLVRHALTALERRMGASVAPVLGARLCYRLLPETG